MELATRVKIPISHYFRKAGTIKMKMIKVWIDEELYAIVKEAADNKSMSVSEYVRDILSKNSYVDITLDFADVYRYVETIEDLKQKINSILPSIFRSGRIYE